MSNKVVYTSDTKKKVDKDTESVLKLYKSTGKYVNSYSFAFNEERNAYDLFITKISLSDLTSETTVEKMKFDSEARALMEVQKRYSEDIIKKGRKR